MGYRNLQFDYAGSSVLITGGSSGLGAGVASAFLEAGAQVTITGTRARASDYDEDLSRYRYVQLDVESKQSVDALADSIRNIDILINSAGVSMSTLGLDEHDPDVFDRAVVMHLSSVFRLASRLEPKLSKSRLPGGASIVSMASMSSLFGFEGLPGYGAAKTGLLGLTRALAVRGATRNIRVNALAVGLTESRMTRAVFDNAPITTALLKRVPLGRHGTPQDVSGAALFLCSDAASWITGQSLIIDGGFAVAGDPQL
jgi:3-oxoacyl-[acyl-carrier protein] reductase